jgi:hypothetical protein
MVFCSTCVWYREQRLYRRPSHTFVCTATTCMHPRALYTCRTPTVLATCRRTPEERNALNDCSDFQPVSWWKVWWQLYGNQTLLILLLWLMGIALVLSWSRHLR